MEHKTSKYIWLKCFLKNEIEILYALLANKICLWWIYLASWERNFHINKAAVSGYLFYKIKLPTTIFESEIKSEQYPNFEEHRLKKEVLASRSLKKGVSLPVWHPRPFRVTSFQTRLHGVSEWVTFYSKGLSTEHPAARAMPILPDHKPLPRSPRMHLGKQYEVTWELPKSWVTHCEGRQPTSPAEDLDVAAVTESFVKVQFGM